MKSATGSPRHMDKAVRNIAAAASGALLRSAQSVPVALAHCCCGVLLMCRAARSGAGSEGVPAHSMIGVEAGGQDSGLRLAELLAAFSLATDLGMGQPGSMCCGRG